MRELMNVLYRLLGNKRYLKDIEAILERQGLSTREEESIRYLMRDLIELENKLQNNKKRFY